MEEFCIVDSGQSLQEGGHRWRQAVVDLVHGRPELQNINIVAGFRDFIMLHSQCRRLFLAMYESSALRSLKVRLRR